MPLNHQVSLKPSTRNLSGETVGNAGQASTSRAMMSGCRKIVTRDPWPLTWPAASQCVGIVAGKSR
jgi:hypothetical protein